MTFETGSGDNVKKLMIDIDEYYTKLIGIVAPVMTPRSPKACGYMSDESALTLGFTKDGWANLLASNSRLTTRGLDPKDKPSTSKLKTLEFEAIKINPWSYKMLASLLVNELLHFYDMKDSAAGGVVAKANFSIVYGDDVPRGIFDFFGSLTEGMTFKDVNSRVSFMHAFYYGSLSPSKK